MHFENGVLPEESNGGGGGGRERRVPLTVFGGMVEGDWGRLLRGSIEIWYLSVMMCGSPCRSDPPRSNGVRLTQNHCLVLLTRAL